MSEQAQGETKWRLFERARVRVHDGHASAVSLRRQQENGARPTSRPSSCRRSTGTRWRFRSAAVRTSFFLWWSLCQSTGKKLHLLGQWTLKKRLAGATSEPIPSCPSCACDWEHLDVAVLPGSCPACWYMHFSCSHLCHLSLPLFLDSLSNNGGFVLQRGRDTFWNSLSLSFSLSLSPSPSSFMARNKSGYGFGAQSFFFFLIV